MGKRGARCNVYPACNTSQESVKRYPKTLKKSAVALEFILADRKKLSKINFIGRGSVLRRYGLCPLHCKIGVQAGDKGQSL
jgi:hypothetical protein